VRRIGAALVALLLGCAPTPTVDPPAATPAPTPAATPGPPPEPLAPIERSFRTVVVDAGHGGEDDGAHGVSGVKEKDVVLATARRLAASLRARGLTVLETRTDDVTVPLSRRTEVANASAAGLFLSVHANSAPNTNAHGIETYSMALASDESAMRLAERENRAAAVLDEAAGLSRRTDEQILESLRHEANADWSRALAREVHRAVVGDLQDFYGRERIQDRRTRTAPFWVLLDTEIPAILLEIGYLTEGKEEQRLRTRAYQDKLAEAVADGVEAFIERAEAAEEGAPSLSAPSP